MEQGGTIDVFVLSCPYLLDHHLEQGGGEWDLGVVAVRCCHDVLLEEHCFVGFCVALVSALLESWR